MAAFTLLYNNKNITTDISQFVTAITYTDKTEKESDELEITVADADQLWQNEWYPGKKAKLTAEIIHENRILKCGVFSLDEINLSGSKDAGDTVTLKGLAAGTAQKLRTKNSYAHENKSLREIVNTIAAAQGLTIDGTVPSISIGRVTQHRETDLSFLHRIGMIYGVMFSVRGTVITFTDIFEVEKRAASLIFDKSDLSDYNLSDKSFLTFEKSRVQFSNPSKKQLITFTENNSSEASNDPNPDTLEIRTKAENEQQARIQAKVALHRANSMQQGGSISFPGNVLFVAGNNMELRGMGYLSGKYHITQSTHTVTKDGGYQGSGEIKRLALIAAEKQKAKASDPKPVATSIDAAPPTNQAIKTETETETLSDERLAANALGI